MNRSRGCTVCRLDPVPLVVDQPVRLSFAGRDDVAAQVTVVSR